MATQTSQQMQADADGVHDPQPVFQSRPEVWPSSLYLPILQSRSHVLQQVRRISSNVPVDITDIDVYVHIRAGRCQPGSYLFRV